MDVIGDVYSVSIEMSERSMNGDKKYSKAKNQANQYYQTLYEMLSEKERSILDKLKECYDIKTERRSKHCFKDGFKAGISVVVQSLY